MLTLFTVAKPFRDEFALIQRNAILSWARLRPSAQILLLGGEAGIHEIAGEVNATHVAFVERNEFGTPLVSSIFSQAEQRAHFPHLCYINADIVLLSDFLPAIREIITWNPRSLIVGRRWDVSLPETFVPESSWENSVRRRIRTEGVLHGHSGLDYFIFPQGLWGELPQFAIGRCLWDGWLLYRARRLGVPIVDATERLTAVHQNHSYSHHPGGELGVWQGVESDRNWKIGGGLKNAYTLRDATHRFTQAGVRRRLVPFDLHRSLVLPFVTHRWAVPLVRLKKKLIRAGRPSRARAASVTTKFELQKPDSPQICPK